ncbi:MAG: hypothetical protein HY674_04075, partial [Chloroflexi bacterium]|nr:hypothetical protein [Chloroflexota bacterium]
WIVLRAVHWFNPLVWLAYRCVRRNRELACDETVLANTQIEEKERYGHTIIRILELGSGFSRNPALRWKPAVTGIVENREQIEERITMIARFKSQAGWSFLAALIFAALGITTLTDGCSRSPTDHPQAAAKPAAPPVDPSAPPRIVSTTPAIGATVVDPGLQEITVTFDRDMGEGFSWTGGGPEYPPGRAGQKPHWRDRRTCVLPVMLASGRYYRVGINSPSYRNFASVEGVPVEPVAIHFTTAGASKALTDKTLTPQVLKFSPANGARDVDPNLNELRVTFNVPMGKGYSWTGDGPQFPPGREGKRPYWTEDSKTCVLPVQLAPGHDYRLGLNSPSHKNFRSASGIALDPVVYTFRTK